MNCLNCNGRTIKSTGPWEYRCLESNCHFAWDKQGEGHSWDGIMRYLKGDDRDIGTWEAIEVPIGTLAVFNEKEL